MKLKLAYAIVTFAAITVILMRLAVRTIITSAIVCIFLIPAIIGYAVGDMTIALMLYGGFALCIAVPLLISVPFVMYNWAIDTIEVYEILEEHGGNT